MLDAPNLILLKTTRNHLGGVTQSQKHALRDIERYCAAKSPLLDFYGLNGVNISLRLNATKIEAAHCLRSPLLLGLCPSQFSTALTPCRLHSDMHS